MRILPLVLFCLSATLFAQGSTELGSQDDTPTLTEVRDGTDAFVTAFEPTDVGFLHVYIDPAVDPLETYLFRGQELGETARALLPTEFSGMEGTFYGAISIMGIEEDLFITRYQGAPRDQIDMFAVRDGEVVHLQTLAYLERDGGTYAQQDSYLTDLNLDTTFDLVTITRQNAEDAEGQRATFTMPRETRSWEETDEFDVPWEGITFYQVKAGQ